MAASKRKIKSGPKGRPSAAPFPLSAWVYGFGILLFLAGQWLLIRGRGAFGFLLSALSLGLLASLFLGWLDPSRWSLPALASFLPRGRGRALPVRKAAPKIIPSSRKPQKPGNVSPLVLLRMALAILSLFLAAKGQVALADMGQTDKVGLTYYAAAVVLFLAALWPWKREGLRDLPLAPRVEWTLFGALFLLAAFLRIYKLDTIPSGVFFDMGFQGYEALRILHEYIPDLFHGRLTLPWELNITENFPSAPVPIYFGAVWFLFFKNTQFNLNLFYVVFSLASLPLIYWTFRQLAGPRVALLALYILAVMRWSLNFSRNSFPPSLLPFFMFATLGCLLYGLKSRKRWPFVTAGILCPIGLYAYQTYVMFLVVLFLCAVYELAHNREAVKANAKNLLLCAAIFSALAAPFFKPMLSGHSNQRFNSLSIFNRCKEQHSLQPLLVNLKYTALMYNRRGDPNPRHNLQDHRQLDDVTGCLLFLGVFYAAVRGWRRKYFYALAGFLVMALPCLITIDPAHSSRMFCQTPFVAFLAATVLAALWSRFRAYGGQKGEVLFLFLALAPLVSMGKQNYHTYFKEQAGNYSSWAEFSVAESMIGRKFAEYGDKYDFYVSPRYYSHYTIDYFDYFFLDKVKRLDLPESLAALPDPGRGVMYALEQGRTGVLDALGEYFPGGVSETLKDPNGNGFVYFYRVPPDIVDRARGLKAEYDDGRKEQASRFPEGLPQGPFQGTFRGVVFIPSSGEHRFYLPEGMVWTLGGEKVRSEEEVRLTKGFHPLVVRYESPGGVPAPVIHYDGPAGKRLVLGPNNFMAVLSPRGLKGSYTNSMDWTGTPFLEQWEPVLNFVNGNDFPVQGGAMGIHWSGILEAPSSGRYRFNTRTSGKGALRIDRKQVIPVGQNSGEVHLTEGPHQVDVYYAKENGWGADFTFSWIKPGAVSMEVVPNSAFGEIH